MEYSSERYEALFTELPSASTELKKGISGVRAKTIRHGEWIDVQLYPIWSTRSIAEQAKRLKKGVSRRAQIELNHRRAQDKLIWLANTNFRSGDGMLTITAFKVPDDSYATAKKHINNYIRRLKRYFAAHGRELKYIYTSEETQSEKNGKRFHAHILCNFHGFDRGDLEKLWTLSQSNTIVCHENQDGFAGMAAYMNIYKEHQQKAGKKAFCCSHNLIQPVITVSDHKVSVRRAAQIAQDMTDGAKEILQNVYKGYACTREVIVRSSDFVPGVYVYARMRRTQ